MPLSAEYEQLKTIPQGLKPSSAPAFMARVNPCPSSRAFFRNLFSRGVETASVVSNK